MPSHSKFAGIVACSAGAYTISQAFTSVSAPKGAVSPHVTSVAHEVPANAPLQGSFCGAVYALSGSVLAVGASQAGLAASKRRAKVRVMAMGQDDEEPAFAPGQQVTLIAPPAMAGKQGTVVGPDLGGAFKVQLASGSIFSIAEENIQGGARAPAPAAAAPATFTAPAAAPVTSFAAPAPVAAAAPSQDDEELAFQPGESVTILAPPALAGKQGTVVGPALGDSFAVQLESGSVFNIATANIQGAGGSAPVAAAAPASFAAAAPAPQVSSAPQVSAAGQDDEELEFTPGQRVTLLAPPAMAGKQGTVVGPALGDSFAVQLESGSIFNFATGNIQDAAAPAPPMTTPAAAPMPAPTMVSSASTSQSEEAEFEQGQTVAILAPPALAGKQGTIAGPDYDDNWMVVLESGSVFSLKAQNLKATVGA